MSKIEIIREVVNRLDPVQLLERGCPANEYEQEIKMFARDSEKLTVSPSAAQKFIQAVFDKQFYAGMLNDEPAKLLASELYSALKNQSDV